MAAEELVRQFADSLHGVVARTGYTQVSCVDLLVGSRHGTSAGALEEAFEDYLETHCPNTPLDGAVVRVRIVEEGEVFRAPGRAEDQTAGGWELLVTNILGRP